MLSSALSNSRSSSTATLRSSSLSSSTLQGTGDTITSETSASAAVGGTGTSMGTGSTSTAATTTTPTTIIQIVNKNGIVLQGYIKKMKTMRKKYFVLYCDLNEKSARLEYFDSEKKFKSHYGENPKRSIKLKSCFHINRRMDTKHKYVIALYTRDDCFCLVFDAEPEMTKWLKELQLLHRDGGEDDQQQSRMKFEHVWQVQVQRKGLAEEKRLIGNYHLCLTDKSLTLARTGAATTHTGEVRLPNVEFLLTTIRRSGASQCFFYMEVGRHSAIGAGELWMETEDPLIAQNMYATIMNAMTNSGNRNKDDFRIRSSSANEASKPIYVQSTSQSPKPFNFANSSESQQHQQQSQQQSQQQQTIERLLPPPPPPTSQISVCHQRTLSLPITNPILNNVVNTQQRNNISEPKINDNVIANNNNNQATTIANTANITIDEPSFDYRTEESHQQHHLTEESIIQISLLHSNFLIANNNASNDNKNNNNIINTFNNSSDSFIFSSNTNLINDINNNNNNNTTTTCEYSTTSSLITNTPDSRKINNNNNHNNNYILPDDYTMMETTITTTADKTSTVITSANVWSSQSPIFNHNHNHNQNQNINNKSFTINPSFYYKTFAGLHSSTSLTSTTSLYGDSPLSLRRGNHNNNKATATTAMTITTSSIGPYSTAATTTRMSRERCDSLPTRNRAATGGELNATMTTNTTTGTVSMLMPPTAATTGTQPLPMTITQQQQQARIMAFTRPHSMYTHRHNSHSPPINTAIMVGGGPLSPSTNSGSGGYSESDGSSLSIDETDGYVYSEDGGNFSSKYVPRSSGSIIPEEILDDQWFDSAKIHFDNLASSHGSLTLPIQNNNNNNNAENHHHHQQQPNKNSPGQAMIVDVVGSSSQINRGTFTDMNSPCGSLPGDSQNNSYTTMSPAIEYSRNVPYDGSSSAHSRTSSLVEDMADMVAPEEYMDMDPQSNSRRNNGQMQYGMNSMSSGASSCSVTSGTPSTDLRFAEYHLDKVVSRFTPDDEDINSNIAERPHRAYSVGSRLEHNKRKVRVDALTAEHNSNQARIRAFSVGSRVTKNPRIGGAAAAAAAAAGGTNPTTVSTMLANISPQQEQQQQHHPHHHHHHHQPHNTVVNTISGTIKNKKSSSVPILINKYPGNNNSGGLAGTSAGSITTTTEHPMDDLMEIDFSKRSDGTPCSSSSLSTAAAASASAQNMNFMSTPLKINVPTPAAAVVVNKMNNRLVSETVLINQPSKPVYPAIRNEATNATASAGGIKYSSQFLGYVEMKPALPNNSNNINVQLGGGSGQTEFDYCDMTRSSGITGNQHHHPHHQMSSTGSLSNSPIKSPHRNELNATSMYLQKTINKNLNLSLQDMMGNDDDDDDDDQTNVINNSSLSPQQQQQQLQPLPLPQPLPQSTRYFPNATVHDDDDDYLNMSPDICNMLGEVTTTKRNIPLLDNRIQPGIIDDDDVENTMREAADVVDCAVVDIDKQIMMHDLINSGTPEGYMEMSFGGSSRDSSNMDTNNNNISSSGGESTVKKSSNSSRFSSLPITIQLTNRFNQRKNVVTTANTTSHSPPLLTHTIKNTNHRPSLPTDKDHHHHVADNILIKQSTVAPAAPAVVHQPLFQFTPGPKSMQLKSSQIKKNNPPITDDRCIANDVLQTRKTDSKVPTLKLSNDVATTATTKLPAMPIVVTLSQQPQSTRYSTGESAKLHHQKSYMDVLNNEYAGMTLRNRSGSDVGKDKHLISSSPTSLSLSSSSAAAATSKDSDYIDFNPSKEDIAVAMPHSNAKSSANRNVQLKQQLKLNNTNTNTNTNIFSQNDQQQPVTPPQMRPETSAVKKSILISNPVKRISSEHGFKSIATDLNNDDDGDDDGDDRLLGHYKDDVVTENTDCSKIRSLSLSSASASSSSSCSSSSITELPKSQVTSASLNKQLLINERSRILYNKQDNLSGGGGHDDSGYEMLKRTADGQAAAIIPPQINQQYKRVSLTRPNSVNSDKICPSGDCIRIGQESTNHSQSSKNRVNPLNSKRPNSVNSDRLPSSSTTSILNSSSSSCFSSTSSSSSSTLCGGGGSSSNSQSPLFILSSSSISSGFGGGGGHSSAVPTAVGNIITTTTTTPSTSPLPAATPSTFTTAVTTQLSQSFVNHNNNPSTTSTLLVCSSSRPESVSSIIDLQLTATSRPSSVSSDRELHYASLDLPTATTVNVQTSSIINSSLNTNQNDDNTNNNNNNNNSNSSDDTTATNQTNNNNNSLLMKKNSLSGESSASPSPSATNGSQIEQPAFTYAQIDFGKSENMKLSKKQQRISKKKIN